MAPNSDRLAAALRAVYERPQPPVPWVHGGNLPWDDPAFGERMLAEHLDQSHGAASRRLPEIRAQVEVMTDWLDLHPGDRLLDVTCGPGLYAAEFARTGIRVTGIDFSPVSIRYARAHCADLPCEFIQADVRTLDFGDAGIDPASFDAAMYIYGQFTVLTPEESRDVLRRIRSALRPGGRLLIETLDDGRFDKKDSRWWYTDHRGLWGDFPFLHLGERRWDPEQRAAVERFYIINLDTGELQSYGLTDQAYPVEDMTAMLTEAGFGKVTVHPAWDQLALNDAPEWVVYVAEA